MSVIIPAHDAAGSVSRSVRSVLDQEFRECEVIVIDDESVDATREIVDALVAQDSRVIGDRFRRNQGVHAARNRGIEMAKGDILVFLDADDELLPGALWRCADIFSRLPETVGVLLANGATQTGEVTGFRVERSELVEFDDLLCERRFYRRKTCFAAVRRQCVGDIRWLAPHCDFIFWRRLEARWGTYAAAEVLMRYNVQENMSLSRSRGQPAHMIRVAPLIAPAMKLFIDEQGARLARVCPEHSAVCLYGLAVSALLAGRRRWAFQALRSLLWHRLDYRVLALLCLLPFPTRMVQRVYAATK